MIAALNQLLAPIRRRLDNLVARAVVQLVTDSTKLQVVQLGILEDETREACERFQSYGLTSVPLSGAEAIVLFAQGLRDHPLIVAIDDRRYRKKNLQPGEVALYGHQGTYLLLKNGSTVEVNAPVDLVAGAVLRVAGTQVVGPQGGAVANAVGTSAGEVAGVLNALLSRLRAHGLIAS